MSEQRDQLRSLAGRLARLSERVRTSQADSHGGSENPERRTTQDRSTTSRRSQSQEQ